MTPKEQAEELILRFKKFSYYPKTKDDDIFVREINKNAKQCALICIDFTIKDAEEHWCVDDKNFEHSSHYNYLTELKQEIINYKPIN